MFVNIVNTIIMATLLQQVDGDESFGKSFSNGIKLGRGCFGDIHQVLYQGKVVAVVKRVSLSRKSVEQLTLQEVPTFISSFARFIMFSFVVVVVD